MGTPLPSGNVAVPRAGQAHPSQQGALNTQQSSRSCAEGRKCSFAFQMMPSLPCSLSFLAIVKVDSCPHAHVSRLGEDASRGCAGATDMAQEHGLGLGLAVLEVNGWTP